MSFERKQQVKEILKDGLPKTTLEILRGIPNRHHSVTIKAVETTLSKMASDGELIRLKSGVYRLANEKDNQDKQSQKSLF